ncbi:type II secretion system protein [Candidatus Roizmanbacteria bacterium]|nr:MAG: type II secretion system protein [Candidatus Roizmanbacteria bacterium]
MLKLRNNKGFTLIELLVVIGILAVLLAMIKSLGYEVYP